MTTVNSAVNFVVFRYHANRRGGKNASEIIHFVSTTNGKHQLGQSVNFVVYCAVSRKFRADVVSMLRCRAAGTNATTSPPLLNGGLVVGPLCPPSPSRGGSVRGKIRQYRESLGGIGSKVHNYQQHQQEGEEDERL